MKIDNPAVTLDDDARIGVKEEVRSGFLDWLHQFTVKGDDGEIYSLGGAILSAHLEQMDIVNLNVAKGSGTINQLPNSIYKLTNFPGVLHEKMFREKTGTVKIERREHSVYVTCGEQYKVECFEDNSWHFVLDTLDGKYKADLYHRPEGYPLWYGKDKPSYLTQHSITYGYNWCGPVDGKIWIDGKEINVKGLGIRERYVAVDSSAAELGGWEDWGWFSFNEFHTSLYDMRLGMKDFSVYDVENKKHYPNDNVNKMEIVHEDWAFMRPLDGFIPGIYNVKFELDDGTLYIRGYTSNASTWGVTFKVPDNPVATLTFDKVEGKFVGKDGTERVLTGGLGALSVRQWHPYPSILPRELYDDSVKTGEKFQTF